MDKRALKILFDTYRITANWNPESKPKTPPEDFAYAKAAGLMFDHVKFSHEEVLGRLFKARDAIESRHVADAFLASLSTRRLELRSALGSYAISCHLAPHRPQILQKQCQICGQYITSSKEDLNVLNFERFNWGGVRHDDPLYAMLDLELFLREEPITPTPEDIALFQNLITAIENAPAQTTAATLHKQWSGLLKSNKAERDVIIEILGFCGILETPEHVGFRTRFIAESERELPTRHYVDMSYPACWWTKRDGINYEALQEWFGHVL